MGVLNEAVITCLIFPMVLCSEYFLENCLLRSKNGDVVIDVSGFYEVSMEPDVVNATYIFSLCTRKSQGCPEGTLFCVKFKNGTTVNLGSTHIGAIEDLDEEKTIVMSLSGENGSGTVNFLCDKSNSDPVVNTFEWNTTYGIPYYNYMIVWASNSICPIKHLKNTCILYTNSGSYDLRALKSPVKAPGPPDEVSYIINFCEVKNREICPGYVCEVYKPGEVPAKRVSDGFELMHMEHKELLAFYYRTYSGMQIIINLKCSPENEENKLEFQSDNGSNGINGSNLVYSMKTPLACEPIKMNCLLHSKDDNNVVYDLSQLQDLLSNYKIHLDERKTLFLNLCGPLTYIPTISCADGNRYFACLADKESRSVQAAANTVDVNLIRPGQVSVIYRGSGSKSLVLNITLVCDQHFSVYPFISKTNANNVYELTWNTVLACPQLYARGTNCKVENLYNLNFMDLNPLHKKESDYYVEYDEESFRINVCGKLSQSCSKNFDAAVCYKNPDGKEIAIGLIGDSEPTFADGQYIFYFQGEPCHKGVIKSRVTLIMACEFSNDTQSNPEIVPSTKDKECSFYFYWKTPLVCGSPISSECTFSNEDLKYDLSPLKNFKENYIVNYKDSTIEMNICHSLIPAHRTYCNEWSGACLINNSIEAILSPAHKNHKLNKNLGLVSKQAEFELIDSKLRLQYMYGGDSCETGKTYSMSIDFICNKTAFHSMPKLIGINDCIYNFTWRTPTACPTYKKKTICSTFDPVSKKKFDLTSLMGNDVLVEGSEIVLGVCQAVGLKGCLPNSGSCVMIKNSYKNIGNFSTQLHYENQSLFLFYETSECKSTVIEFRCIPEDSLESKPLLIKETNCSTFISWPTNLACLNDNAINKCCQGIEGLCQKLNHTFEVDVNQKEKVFINVCMPLLPKRGLLCPPGAVSCLASNNSLDSFTSEKSIGSTMIPAMIHDDMVVVKYFDGSVCHKESGVRYSTSITFVCDEKATHGHPELINISDDCQYEFKWRTSLMCQKECTLPLHLPNWDKRLVSANNQSSYILNLCHVSEKCGSHICKLTSEAGWQKFAALNNTRSLNVKNGKTELFYTYLRNKTEKDTCGAEVDLICDINSNGPGRPYLEKEQDCYIHVIWKSSLACLSESSSETTKSSNAGVWIVFSTSVMILLAVISALVWYKPRTNWRSIFYRLFGYSRSRSTNITELEELTSEEGMDPRNFGYLNLDNY